MNTKSERFEMRLEQEIIEKIDDWRADQESQPSRAEAVRQLVMTALNDKFRGTENLTLYMLCELYRGLNIQGEIDPKFLQKAILGGHVWALNWTFDGFVYNYKDGDKTAIEVSNILDMWSFLEEGLEKLSKKEKDLVEERCGRVYSDKPFIGFDGNNESRHRNVARFMIEEMGYFERFKGRDLNSHCPVLPTYRAMLPVFSKYRNGLIGRSLSSREISDILDAANKAVW
jgi:uncharacterized protein